MKGSKAAGRGVGSQVPVAAPPHQGRGVDVGGASHNTPGSQTGRRKVRPKSLIHEWPRGPWRDMGLQLIIRYHLLSRRVVPTLIRLSAFQAESPSSAPGVRAERGPHHLLREDPRGQRNPVLAMGPHVHAHLRHVYPFILTPPSHRIMIPGDSCRSGSDACAVALLFGGPEPPALVGSEALRAA